MKILVLNAGSSSLKYKLFADEVELAGGVIEAIGECAQYPDHKSALTEVCHQLDLTHIDAVGHRVVHGGTAFFKPTEMDDATLEVLKSISFLAPLHNPANILGIELARQLLPQSRHFAVFDTAFHHTLPEAAYTYALDRTLIDALQIRRYGFHGISHEYVSREACKILNSQPENTSLISLHLGNGASACAIQNGSSIDISMGMTPLEGLVMGTRSGDLDPAVSLLLAKHLGSLEAADTLLNKKSGLKGLCGDNDLRMIEARASKNDSSAKLALDVMIHRLVKYIGSYYALLPNLKAIIFTGGIGENSKWVREAVLSKLGHLGLDFDPAQNVSGYQKNLRLTAENSRIAAFAIRTNEEFLIADLVAKSL